MRFTSPYGHFKITAVKADIEWLASGNWRVPPGGQKGYICEFGPMGFTSWEREEAHRYFGDRISSGRRKADSTLTTDSPMDWRIGTFDTDEIEDETLRKRVEEALLKHEGYGRDYMHFPKPKAPAPWPNYDRFKAGGRGRTNEQVADELVKLAIEFGADPGACMAYESENLNRPEVIAAFERLAASDDVEEKITVSA